MEKDQRVIAVNCDFGKPYKNKKYTNVRVKLWFVKSFDCIVHQLYHVAIGGLVVLGSTEASQSLLVHKDAEGVTGCHQHVDTQVEFVAVNNEWLEQKTCTILVADQFVVYE